MDTHGTLREGSSVPALRGAGLAGFHKGFLPFVPGGLLKAIIAGLLTSLAWRLRGLS
ncbi:hypothetical protein KH5H1_73080 [Corallococcus caeni]|nr:hypothetical protein KH5H1_73080 [Corallococcus sp. KH5-1]